jgi:hypothetical protein
VKSYVAAMVGKGYPAMASSDGPALYHGSADDLRKAAWYSLTGGAAGWDGYSSDTWLPTPNAIDNTKLQYYGYLLSFLDNNAVRFWEMTPQQSLISTNTTNSLLANIGSQYLGYVLSGATVDITLGTGTYHVTYFDPVTGATTTGSDMTGPATRTFNRPTGASDWVVFAYTETNPVYVTTTSLPNGKVGDAYLQTLTATGGIPSPYTWSIISGSLPAGLVLSGSTGVIAGTPTTAGTSTFTVQAQDNSSNSGTMALSLVIAEATPGGQTTIKIPADQGAITDTYINVDNINYSDNAVLRTYTWPAYTRASMSILKATLGLPNNVSIISARLYLYMSGFDYDGRTNPERVYAQRISGTTNLATVTGNNFDNSTLQTYESVTDVSTTPGWFSWDVSAMTAWAYANASDLYVALSPMQDGASDTNRIFVSMDGAAAFRPYITVTYMNLVGPGGPSISAPGKFRVSRLRGRVR